MKNTKNKASYKSFGLPDLFIGIFLVGFALVILYPFYNSLLVSITPQGIYTRTPFMLWPKAFTSAAYVKVITNKFLMNGLWVTAVITVVGVIYNMTLTVFTAYALTKPFPGKKLVMNIIIVTMYFNGGLIPYYLLMRNLHLIDKIAVMIIPMGFNVFYLIVVRTFISQLPDALEESAKIDGANDLTILLKIIIPLSLPIIATFSLYYGVARWNEWWHGLLFIKSPDKQPMQLVLRSIIQESSNEDFLKSASGVADIETFPEGIKMASITITMLPIMCVYPFLQKYFIKGLTLGAVKG